MREFDLPKQPRILVVTLRRLGDVLLTTPLVRSLRRAYPGATLDLLVFAGSDRILEGNADIDRVLTMPERPSLAASARLAAQIWRRYDLAISTQTGDRPTFFAWAAARRRVGAIPAAGEGAWWKRRLLHRAVAVDADNHRVTEVLRLAQALGIVPVAEVVCPHGMVPAAMAPRGRYAVVHVNPLHPYKRWTDAGWRAVAIGLAKRGLAVIVSEGQDPAERAYVDGVFSAMDVTRLYGQLEWGALAELIKGAVVFIGPDTSVTHLAAASGAPTIALFGPTDPRLWGPWPATGRADPWLAAGTIQRQNNVWVVQNPLPCLPCRQEGCDRHLLSRSQCLDELAPERVLAAVDQALATSAIHGGVPA